MKQKLQKDLQLLMDLNNEYEEKEKDAKKVVEERREYRKTIKLFSKMTKEEEEAIAKYCKQEKQIENDKEVINIAIQITKNNIDLSLNEIVDKELIPIIQKYKNKRIGEKTKEKIANEIKEYAKEKYNFIVYFNMYQDYYFTNISLLFGFYTENAKKIGTIEKCSNEKEYNENTFNDLYNYNVNIDYTYINDAKNYADKLYIAMEDSKKKIDELKKQIDNEKNNINEYLNNHLNDYRL